jgi:hypothetical protein
MEKNIGRKKILEGKTSWRKENLPELMKRLHTRTLAATIKKIIFGYPISFFFTSSVKYPLVRNIEGQNTVCIHRRSNLDQTSFGGGGQRGYVKCPET